PSRMTASTGRPSNPPAALTRAIARTTASTSDDSLDAIVPVNECRTPTRIGAPAGTVPTASPTAASNGAVLARTRQKLTPAGSTPDPAVSNGSRPLSAS